MSSKRKRVVLSITDKVKIIEQLNKGVSNKFLAETYNVGTSTISDFKKNSSAILKFASNLQFEDGSPSRKNMKTAENKELEQAMIKWFLQQRSIGNPLSGPILCEKAKIFAEKMDNLSEFKASDGWLRNFKARHGIRELDLCGEKLSADNTAAEKFIEEFKTKIENYDPEFVFNADETGLNWKALPRKTLASKRETSAPGHKVSKDRVTVLTCANSTGNHRLPLLLIGKSKNPRAFKNVKKLPVVYKNQNKAWMTSALFTEWFDDVFIPDVKKYQKKINKKGNVLLLLDNAPTHPSESLLERENGRFKALFLPPNVTSLLQPMDQGIIECLKRLYKKQLLRKLLLADENEEGTLIYHKNINIKDCCYMVADAWSSVKAITLKRAWNKINGISTQQQIQEEKENAELKNNEESDKDTDSMSTENLQNMITKVPGCSECNVEDIEDWLHSDSIDPGFQLLSDDEIIQSTKEESYPVDSEDDNDSTFELEAGPSASEAFACFETALNWMERQSECDHVDLLVVKRLKDLAAKKRVSSLKQRTLTEMFK
ncbi:jerky protein homolog-like [Anastrepha ludens]|uniref:jerky protein homolog-like n=2 Tax=Anastrepha ludens TaxID=28586 RepID=UPI0023AFB42D|nr:jerky protein homolog-like [Anastrepha ludens]